MKLFKKILDKNDLKVDKYTMKGKTMIVNTPLGQFALKKGNLDNIYKYLLSRNFEYFPKVIDSNEDSTIYEFVDDVKYDNEQRAFDLIHTIALLHSKTTYYKDVDIDEYKKIFEETMEKINYIYNYYMDVINIIESKIYMSPSEYLIARNISKIFSCIYFCKNELEQWYEIVKNEKRKRVVTLHNNLKLDNIIRNKSVYLIGWEYSKIDSPIYDFINFYNNYALYFDFRSLLNEYERIFPFKEEEKKLLSVLISIPSKISNTEKEYNKVKNVRQLLDKIYKTEMLLTPKEKEETKSTQK
jgi:spore coat protein ysxE